LEERQKPISYCCGQEGHSGREGSRHANPGSVATANYGNATQAEISRAFGVPLVTVKRYVKLFRESGAAAFFAPAKKRSGSKLTAEVCQQVQGLLDQGLTVPEVGRELGILSNTLHKAIRAGRLRP
jgi:transposase-like protein